MQAHQPISGEQQANTPAADLRLVSVEQLRKIHRELDACQKVIHYAGGFDPAYVTDAKKQLQVIEALIESAKPEALNDTARLDFMLEQHRKVVVELIPRGRHAVYVEEGFMGDEQYPAVTYLEDWDEFSGIAKEAKRKAIDAAIAAQQVNP